MMRYVYYKYYDLRGVPRIVRTYVLAVHQTVIATSALSAHALHTSVHLLYTMTMMMILYEYQIIDMTISYDVPRDFSYANTGLFVSTSDCEIAAPITTDALDPSVYTMVGDDVCRKSLLRLFSL